MIQIILRSGAFCKKSRQECPPKFSHPVGKSVAKSAPNVSPRQDLQSLTASFQKVTRGALEVSLAIAVSKKIKIETKNPLRDSGDT